MAVDDRERSETVVFQLEEPVAMINGRAIRMSGIGRQAASVGGGNRLR